MDYPKRIITKGETDKKIVKAIQTQLNAKGCGPVAVDGDFGPGTVSAVKLFQTRNADSNGSQLKADGKIGAITWSTLFGEETVPVIDTTSSAMLQKVLEIAVSQIGVSEDPNNKNRGLEVDEYLRRAGLEPKGQHYSWCMAFVYWCFDEAAKSLGKKNPLVKTAGCLRQWNETTCPKVKMADAKNNPSLVKPGFVFIIDHGKGNGHTGIVESVNGGYLNTIEGNTSQAGSREGTGVMRLTRRKIGDITKGFINAGKA
nr:CHAP domain-containing protein [Bacteroidota bacterium]